MEYEVVLHEFRHALGRQILDRPSLRVLDAGCGTRTHLELPVNAHVVGIDISADALEQNEALDERIVDDLETIELAPKSFDVIVCWWVLEHLRRPDHALDSFIRALDDGGLLVLGVPNVLSVKGIITKYTPYSFHRWIYKWAGASASDPHRTFLRGAISPRAVQTWALGTGLRLEYLGFFEAPIQVKLRKALHLSGWGWSAISVAIRTLSLGFIATDDTEYIAIFSRPAGSSASAVIRPVP